MCPPPPPPRNKAALDIRNHLRRRFRPLSRPPLISVAHARPRFRPFPVSFPSLARGVLRDSSEIHGLSHSPPRNNKVCPLQKPNYSVSPLPYKKIREGLANLFWKTRASGLWRYKVKPLAFVRPSGLLALSPLYELFSRSGSGSSGRKFLTDLPSLPRSD